jgi:hypothetical protein
MMMNTDWQAFKAVVREVLLEEMALGSYEMTPKFDGGTLVLKPADPSGKPKEIPVETFFKKITSVREKLRVLEQKINNAPGLSGIERAEIQGLITRVYGSLTTFNVLFRNEEDRFVGMKGE